MRVLSSVTSQGAHKIEKVVLGTDTVSHHFVLKNVRYLTSIIVRGCTSLIYDDDARYMYTSKDIIYAYDKTKYTLRLAIVTLLLYDELQYI